jgi:large subunit ribosomal protein L17
MRHGNKLNHLGRTSSHRKAMLSNMAASLILHKRINTTLAKAKALRVYVEPLISKSKDDSTHNRRTVFAYLKSKEAVTELFRTVSPKVGERPGGYTRIIKMAPRLGDNAEMALIELVDFNDLLLAAKAESSGAKAKTTRRSRSSKKSEGSPSSVKVAGSLGNKVDEIQDALVVDDAPLGSSESNTGSSLENALDDEPKDNNEVK